MVLSIRRRTRPSPRCSSRTYPPSRCSPWRPPRAPGSFDASELDRGCVSRPARHGAPHQGPFPVSGGGFRNLSRGSFATTPWRWRWDLNPRWTFTHTRFRVLRTHVQARSETSAPCSTGRSASVAEPSRTTTNETRTETRQLRRRESDSCPAGCGISEPCSGRCPSPRLAERGRGGRPGKRAPRRPLRRCALSTSTPSQSRSPVPPSRPPVCYLPMPSVRPRRNCR